MTDRDLFDLLELAAKAAGLYYWIDGDVFLTYADTPEGWREWNPLTDDGDALRLAVELRMEITVAPVGHTWADVRHSQGIAKEIHGDDPCAATRRAIVRAAAEIGKVKP